MIDSLWFNRVEHKHAYLNIIYIRKMVRWRENEGERKRGRARERERKREDEEEKEQKCIRRKEVNKSKCSHK